MKKMIHIGQGRYVAPDAVASVNTQMSATFRAFSEGELNGKPVSELSEEELTTDAFVVVTPKIGQPIGMKATDETVEAYTEEVVAAINEGRDADVAAFTAPAADPDEVANETNVVGMTEAGDEDARAKAEAKIES